MARADLLLAGDVGGGSAGCGAHLREPAASPVRQNRWRRMNTMITGTIETSEPVITDSWRSGARAVWPFHW